MFLQLRHWCWLLTAVCCSSLAQAQSSRLENVLQSFHEIADTPHLVRFPNCWGKTPAGGHIQGIQSRQQRGSEQIAITASSWSTSYLVVVRRNGEQYSGRRANLLRNPYRHAGGCQLYGATLAVGLEDNYRKDQSKIVLLSLEDSATTAPVQTAVSRAGAPKRATAGAVGYVHYAASYLLAVADWDAHHIDFYTASDSAPQQFSFHGSCSIAQTGSPCAYQCINLFVDTSDHLFLIGLGKDKKGNRADLFQVYLSGAQATFLQVAQRYFSCTRGISFRYAAGVALRKNGLAIYATTRRLHRKNRLNLFIP